MAWGKTKKLGIAPTAQRYDLPLHRDSGAHFLIGLIAMMTFLICIMATATIAVENTTTSWVSGLSNTLTIEIPAVDAEAKNLSQEQMDDLATKTQTAISALGSVQSAGIMSRDDLSAMVAPWLGEDATENTSMPLPVLITVTLNEDTDYETATQSISTTLQSISPILQMDTHETWLNDLNKLVGGLQMATLIITLMIIVATILIILMALRMRMSVHKKDIELLHLMGAGNLYIAKQFQRHGLLLTLKGSVAGMFAALILVGGLHLLKGSETSLTNPTFFDISMASYITMIATPLILGLIGFIATRFIVLRVLEKMP
jgi:cell division transport system permease protein